MMGLPLGGELLTEKKKKGKNQARAARDGAWKKIPPMRGKLAPRDRAIYETKRKKKNSSRRGKRWGESGGERKKGK